VVGYQAGGEIVEVGAEVTDLKVGQKVTTVSAPARTQSFERCRRATHAGGQGFDIKLRRRSSHAIRHRWTIACRVD